MAGAGRVCGALLWNDSLRAVIFPHLFLNLTTFLSYLCSKASVKAGRETCEANLFRLLPLEHTQA